MENKLKYALIALSLSLLFFIILGIPTALIPTWFFKRMIIPNVIDYILLGFTSILAGSYISYSIYVKKPKAEKGNYAALGGVFTGIFSFGCSICNVLLVSIFSTTTLLVFFEPYRHYLGLITITLFAFAFYFKVKKCKKC